MTARTVERPGRANYYVMLDYKDEKGRRKQKWIATDIPIKGNNKRAIEERRKEIETEYENQNLEETAEIDLRGDTLFTDYLQQWLLNQKSALADSTYQVYEYQITKCVIPWFLPKKLTLKELTFKDIDAYKDAKLDVVSSNTVRKYLTNISQCLESATKAPNPILPFNPAKCIVWPKKVEFMGAQIYDDAQIRELLEASKGDPMELMILLTIYYGLRRSEVLGLKWDAVNFVQGTITIKHTVTKITAEVNRTDTTKTKSSYRVLPLSEDIKKQLQSTKKQQFELRQDQPNDYKDSCGYIFTRGDGAPMGVDYPSQHFQILLKKCGLPAIRFHDLRHP